MWESLKYEETNGLTTNDYINNYTWVLKENLELDYKWILNETMKKLSAVFPNALRDTKNFSVTIKYKESEHCLLFIYITIKFEYITI